MATLILVLQVSKIVSRDRRKHVMSWKMSMENTDATYSEKQIHILYKLKSNLIPTLNVQVLAGENTTWNFKTENVLWR